MEIFLVHYVVLNHPDLVPDQLQSSWCSRNDLSYSRYVHYLAE